VGTVFGASAGSIVLLLLFVFYSSFVLYYGASFIRVFAEATDQKIEPIRKAYVYEMEEQK
jgi:membrane protein